MNAEQLELQGLTPHIRPRAAVVEPSEFVRMRRPRAEFRASCRRAGARHLRTQGGPVVTVREIGEHSTEFDGATAAVVERAEAIGVAWMRPVVGAGVLVPRRRAEDLVAALEQIGKRIELVA